MEAAFFDLDKTVIATSSVMALGGRFYREGLISKGTIMRGIYAQIVYLLLGADDEKMERMREAMLGLTKGWDQARVSEIVRETLDDVEGVIAAIGPNIHYVGEGEQARIVKLAINLMIAVLAQVMSEALVLGEAAGVSRAALLDVMASSAAGAPFVKYKTEALLRDDFSATFTTSLMEKDIDLVLDAAGDAGLELPLAREMKKHLRAAVDAGYADDDFIALFLQLRSASSLASAAAPPARVSELSHQEVVQ